MKYRQLKKVSKLKRQLIKDKRFRSWLPILEKDNDYTHLSMERILAFKFNRMIKYLEKHGYADDSKRIIKRLKYAIYLIERLQSCEDEDKLMAAFDNKYGEAEYVFIDTDGGKYSRMEAKYPLATTPELHEEANKARADMFYACVAQEKKLYNRLFKHLAKYWQTFFV